MSDSSGSTGSFTLEHPALREIVAIPMSDGIIGDFSAQPCHPERRTHWMVIGIIGDRARDWLPLRQVRGKPPSLTPERELAEVLSDAHVPVTIDLYDRRMGPYPTLEALATGLAEFIATGHTIPMTGQHPLALLFGALAPTPSQGAAAAAPRFSELS